MKVLLKIVIILIVFFSLISCKEKNLPPTCEITAPIRTDDIFAGDTVVINVDTKDEDGEISEVRFFINGIGVGSSISSPYSYSWVSDSANPGTYFLRAISYDDKFDSAEDEVDVELQKAIMPPVAAYSGDPISGDSPLTVSFIDHSANEPNSLFWEFGDGETSTVSNPKHTYTQPGSYTVKLFVENQAGSDYLVKNNYIQVEEVIETPNAEFIGEPTFGYTPLSVSFKDISTNNPTNWRWNLGDGTISYLQNPTHTYEMPGSYSVSLLAENSVGTDTEVKTNYIVVDQPGEAPIAEFSSDSITGMAPITITFVDESLHDPNVWNWNFGDGETSDLQNPSHIYRESGIYTVSLIVTNNFGNDTVTKTNYIVVDEDEEPPLTEFVAIPTNGVAPLSVAFSDNSSNNPSGWSWDFGDGATSELQHPDHLYSDPGIFTVTLTTENDFGVDTKVKQNYIHVDEFGYPPSADFEGAPVVGEPPLTVNFIDKTTNNPQHWYWEFGDGNISTSQNPTHTYTEVGAYDVNLSVANEFDMDVIEKSEYVNVYPGSKPVAGFYASPLSGICPLEVNFYDTSLNEPDSWTWTLGSGSSGYQNPTVIFENPGTYHVSLSARNRYGSDYIVKMSYIHVEPSSYPPAADFIGAPRVGEVPLTVEFTDLTTNDPDIWLWEFGDGETSSLQNPTHTYEEVGTYNVKLTASNENSSDIEMKHYYILVEEVEYPPVAGFYGEPLSGNYPLLVIFYDTSQNDYTHREWDFGDSDSKSSQEKYYDKGHWYTEPGEYTVSLTITGELGSDTETKVDYIEVFDDGPPGDPCPDQPILTDIDGNEYNTIILGDQCWMKENLRVTKYPNGDEIPYIYDDDEWAALGDIPTDDAYCYYENNPDNNFGCLYTYGASCADQWQRDNVEGQGICPDGWHLPTTYDWDDLRSYLIEHRYNYNAHPTHNYLAKSLASKTGWAESTRLGAIGNKPERNNLTGFNAYSGGFRGSQGFQYAGYYSYWWCNPAFIQGLDYNSSQFFEDEWSMNNGLYVRCIKN